MATPTENENSENHPLRVELKRRWRGKWPKRVVYYVFLLILCASLAIEALSHFFSHLPKGEVLLYPVALACLGMLIIIFELLLEIESEEKEGASSSNLQEAAPHIESRTKYEGRLKGSALRESLWIVGHRGICRDGVENTLSTFRRAVKCGADWIEIDVHAVRGALVVYHDDQVNGRPVKDQDLDELRQFQYPNGESIPTLEEVIRDTDPSVGLGVEIKKGDVEARLAEMLRPLLGRRKMVVSSFHYEALGRIKKLCPEMRIGILTDRLLPDLQRQMDMLGAEVLFPASNLVNADLVKLVRQAGYRICPWTVNEQNEMVDLIGLGVDGIITDYPERLVEVLKSLRG